jgi:hypothetical protein
MSAAGAIDRTIYGAFDGEIRALPELFGEEILGRDLRKDRAAAWAAKQGKDRKAAEELVKLIQHISADQFVADLRVCVRDAEKGGAFSGRNVVFVEPGKSQTYCVALVRDVLSSSLLLKIGEQGADCLQASIDALFESGGSLDEVNDFVFIDDASFTGLQMRANLSGTAQLLRRKFPSLSPRFHVIVPYMTAEANEMLRTMKGVDVRVYTSATRIHTLRDLPRKYFEGARKLLGDRGERSLGFLYTDLKVPNRMSFPETLAEFIPDHLPVYKQPPFVVEEEVTEAAVNA